LLRITLLDYGKCIQFRVELLYICCCLFLGVKGEENLVEGVLMFRADMSRKVINDGEPAHQIDLNTGSVEDTRIATRLILYRDQTLIHFAYHLRVYGDLLIQGGIFSDREVVVFKEGEEAMPEGIGEVDRVLGIERVLPEESSVEIGGVAERLPEGVWEVAVSPVEPVVESLEEENVEPFADEGICGLVCLEIGLIEGAEELRVVAEPSFALNEVEEEASAEELLGGVVCPVWVAGLMGEVVLKGGEDLFIVFKEGLCHGFNVEGVLVCFSDL